MKNTSNTRSLPPDTKVFGDKPQPEQVIALPTGFSVKDPQLIYILTLIARHDQELLSLPRPNAVGVLRRLLLAEAKKLKIQITKEKTV